MKQANSMLESVRLEVDRETEQIVHRLSDSLQAAAQYEPRWAEELRGEVERRVSRQQFEQSGQLLEQRLQTLERRLLEEVAQLRMHEQLDTLVQGMATLQAARNEPAWATELRSELEKRVSQQLEQSGQLFEQRLQTLERRLLQELTPSRVLERLETLMHRMDAQAELLREQKKVLEEQSTRLRRLERPWYRRIFG